MVLAGAGVSSKWAPRFIYTLLGMNVFMSYPGDSIEIAILIKFLVSNGRFTVLG